MPDENSVKSGATSPQGNPSASGSSAKPGSQAMPPPTITKKKAATSSRVARGGARHQAFLAAAVHLLWSGARFVFKLNGGVFKFFLWNIPCRIYQAFHRIKSKKLRRAAALGAGLLIGIGVFFLWPVSNDSISAGASPETRHGAGRNEAGAPASASEETCEFLARPAAKLFIDGELASPEVPPIFRTRLKVGQHSIQFVSPDGRTHETPIEVIKGEPTQWFMSFINGALEERPLTPGLERK